MREWILEHKPLLATLGVLSVVFFVASLVAMPFLIARIPAEHFATAEPPPGSFGVRHPLARLALRVARNLVGVLLFLAGVAMLVLPGQGVIAILLGLFLLDFRGKRAWELALLRRPLVRRSNTGPRRRRGRPPLHVFGAPPPTEESS